MATKYKCVQPRISLHVRKYSSKFSCPQVCASLNHVGTCLSYPATIRLLVVNTLWY